MTSSQDDAVLTTASTYEREADAWRSHTPSERSAWQPSYSRFLSLISPGVRILDLGCGSGEDSPALSESGRIVVGLDISVALLRVAGARPLLFGRILNGDLRRLPFAEASFEGVWADGSLHHIAKQDLPSVLEDIHRVLKQGGAFAASVERGNDEGFVDHDGGVDGPRWYAHYEPEELGALFNYAGFRVIGQIVAPPSPTSTNGFIALFARKP